VFAWRTQATKLRQCKNQPPFGYAETTIALRLLQFVTGLITSKPEEFGSASALDLSNVQRSVVIGESTQLSPAKEFRL
jgi:hypothetical protein